MTQMKQIVPKESAHISGHEVQSIHADHVNMCKFKSDSDDGYDKVHRVLERWAAKLNSSQKPQERVVVSSATPSGDCELYLLTDYKGPHNNTGRVNFNGNDNQGSIFGKGTGGSGSNYFGKGN